MTIKTERQHLDCMCGILLNYFPLLRNTLTNNVRSSNKVSAEYLECRVVVSIIKELEFFFKRKQLSLSNKIKLNLSEAQGVYLFKIILDLPINQENYYTNNVRQNWLDQLNQQIIYTIPS